MKKIILTGLVVLLFACNSQKHLHDGKYETTIEVFGVNFAKIEYTLNGNEMIIDNSVSGVSKLHCQQYEDRIEYIEKNGTTRVLSVLENGDIKFNDQVTLKKIIR